MDKLTKVLKVRVQEEQDSATALAQSRQALLQAEQQKEQLDELTNEYRRQHAEIGSASVSRFKQFNRFYSQLNVAVTAQQDVLERLADEESRQSEAFISRHKDRRALEMLLEQRDLAHKTEQLRRERRSARGQQTKPLV